MTVSVQRALEDLRVVSLEVLPTVPRRHLPLLDAQAIRVVQGLQQLCRGILLAAYASFSDLHCTAMAKIRKEVLSHLADAEACLVEKATVSGQQLRTLQFAEEFEDLELFIKLQPMQMSNVWMSRWRRQRSSGHMPSPTVCSSRACILC